MSYWPQVTCPDCEGRGDSCDSCADTGMVNQPADERRGSPLSAPRDFFDPETGGPTDACPNCGIHRRHAGNPGACGPHWRKPGCFDLGDAA